MAIAQTTNAQVWISNSVHLRQARDGLLLNLTFLNHIYSLTFLTLKFTLLQNIPEYGFSSFLVSQTNDNLFEGYEVSGEMQSGRQAFQHMRQVPLQTRVPRQVAGLSYSRGELYLRTLQGCGDRALVAILHFVPHRSRRSFSIAEFVID